MNYRLIALLCLLVVGCSTDRPLKDGAPDIVPIDVMAVPDAVPRHEIRTRAGNAGRYQVLGRSYQTLTDNIGFRQRGQASWYGKKFHGQNTSNGEIYDMFAMTAAHKTLPIPSYVRVTNLENQKSVVVRINDRGPFHDDRVIDLSYTAAAKLGMLAKGTAPVEVVAVQPEPLKPKQQLPVVAATDTGLYLQIGAFADQLNALRLQQKILAMALSAARLKVAHSNGRPIYKVQLGPVDSIEVAAHINQQLMAAGITDTKLINEE